MKNAVPSAFRTAAAQVPKTKTKTKYLKLTSVPRSF